MSLMHLGNAKAWADVRAHMMRKQTVPLVVWGNTGVGKSYGLMSVISSCNLLPVVLDGTDAYGENLVSTVSRLRQTQQSASGKQVVVVIEDYEGFSDETRIRLGDYLRKRGQSNEKRDIGRLIITMTQRQEPAMKLTRFLPAVKINKPSYATINRWFESHHRWTCQTADSQIPTERIGFCPSLIKSFSDLIIIGDLRRLSIALIWKWAIRSRQRATHPGSMIVTNCFDAIRGLMAARNTSNDSCMQWWMQHAHDFDLGIVRENIVKFVRNIDELARMLDVFSTVIHDVPFRFELNERHRSFGLALFGMVIKGVVAEEGSIGPLPPPPSTLYNISRTGRPTDEGGFPIRMCEWLDRPGDAGIMATHKNGTM